MRKKFRPAVWKLKLKNARYHKEEILQTKIAAPFCFLFCGVGIEIFVFVFDIFVLLFCFSKSTQGMTACVGAKFSFGFSKLFYVFNFYLFLIHFSA